MFDFTLLWRSPDLNPINKKARSIPALNLINIYGRVFFYSWFSFLIAFWSWYAFPPLLHAIIAEDVGLSDVDVANSNIIALVATLLVRLISGPSCDRFGPRVTFAACLLAGAVPTFLAGAVFNASGLLALRFFIGILGASFVPCQVWSTGFFDKNVVGTANALTAGFGNAGGGITYFAMPHIYASLVSNGLTPHDAWRVSFVVPGILIVSCALTMLWLCPDCPTGKWSERNAVADENLRNHSITGIEVPEMVSSQGSVRGDEKLTSKEKIHPPSPDQESQVGETQIIDIARGEVIQKPTLRETAQVVFSLPTLVLGAAYFCSFGSELAINSILSAYYEINFPSLGLTGAGNWAAMFGLLNVVFRPLGGALSDLAYAKTRSLWLKKALVHAYSIIFGVFLIIIGTLDPHDQSTMFGLVSGMAFFLEGGNGLVFSLVPHVHPYANGIVSGLTGASGNLGGIVFAIIFRYNGVDYARVFWIIGVMVIAINVAVSWIRPIPKGQIGGR